MQAGQCLLFCFGKLGKFMPIFLQAKKMIVATQGQKELLPIVMSIVFLMKTLVSLALNSTLC
jgi:hypothetical protein